MPSLKSLVPVIDRMQTVRVDTLRSVRSDLADKRTDE